MRWLIKVGGIGIMVFSITIWGALMLGEQMIPPTFAGRYAPNLCAGVPCVLDIVPGQTAWQEAQQRLATQPGGDIGRRHIIINTTRDGEIGFYPSVNSEYVGRIYSSYSPQRSIAIGWIVSTMGAPCGVSYYWRGRTNILTLRYPLMIVNLRLETFFTPYSPIDSIQLNDPTFSIRAQPDICIDTISNGVNNNHWRGFFNLRIYKQPISS
jgi:hypothetical protein